MNERLKKTLDGIESALNQMKHWGWRGFACSQQSLETLSRWSRPPDGPVKNETLEQIRADLGDCRRCSLCERRTHIVFGEGRPNARLVFVGEGPGVEEDQSGRPFVGPAGQLLDRIITAMKLPREQVYICNVIKCRPPDNRDPSAEEVKTCKPFLERQLAVIQPEVICALGAHAARTLLDTTASISALRGRFHEYAGIRTMPTYHPAFLLRHPEEKRAVWEDMQKIMALLKITL